MNESKFNQKYLCMNEVNTLLDVRGSGFVQRGWIEFES
jgi:hypothetical protein